MASGTPLFCVLLEGNLSSYQGSFEIALDTDTVASLRFAVVLHLQDDIVHSLKLSELGFLHGENILKPLQVRLLDGCSESRSADNGCARERDCKRGRGKNCFLNVNFQN